MIRLSLILIATSTLLPGQQPPAIGNQAAQTASWRERYELGAGDQLNLKLYGKPEFTRTNLKIAPDGTISYLQAHGVLIAGQTIDEARATLEAELSKHFKSPRLIVTPGEIGSKRFTILGSVVNRGNFTLERPLTLVEAIAAAGGLETGLSERNTIELADLDRSFVSRQGRPLAIDFRRVLHENDMTQNVEIEPGDFIFIASSLSNQYYVLGAVNSPGAQGFTAGSSVATAMVLREGYTDKAWLERILVVRGRMDNPQVHVVSVGKILAGQEPDFLLKPDDLVYVADRPWAKAEEILGYAMRAFITSVSTSWTNLNVQPLSD